MQIYPAIDIKQGQCVRLRQGVFSDMEVYSDSPWEIAKEWEACGATFIHVVDLDGALNGYSVNYDVIEKIAKSVSCPIQLGGGIREMKAIDVALDCGISRVIIGTKAVENPDFIKDAVEKYGSGRIVAGVDAKDGFVAVKGWEELSGKKASDLCMRMKEYGVRHVVYTDISRDGMLLGPNVKATKELTDITGMDIIASGGVSCMNDLESLHENGISGVIIGKALYEKRIDLKEAIKLFEKE